MATSQNGWKVFENAPPVAELIPGVLSLRVCPGDVALIFSELARRYHRDVEPLRPDKINDDWGWAYRPVRGQGAGFSNHASGTAVDFNATQHGRGVHNTFTAAEERAVREILEYFEDNGHPVLRWGEDYTTTVDGMHFEINAGSALVKRVADKIRRDRNTTHSPPEDDDMKASDPVRLGPGSSAVLGQKDGVITFEESVALQTAAAVQTVQVLQAFIAEQRKANAQILAVSNTTRDLVSKLILAIDEKFPCTPA